MILFLVRSVMDAGASRVQASPAPAPVIDEKNVKDKTNHRCRYVTVKFRRYQHIRL